MDIEQKSIPECFLKLPQGLREDILEEVDLEELRKHEDVCSISLDTYSFWKVYLSLKPRRGYEVLSYLSTQEDTSLFREVLEVISRREIVCYGKYEYIYVLLSRMCDPEIIHVMFGLLPILSDDFYSQLVQYDCVHAMCCLFWTIALEEKDFLGLSPQSADMVDLLLRHSKSPKVFNKYLIDGIQRRRVDIVQRILDMSRCFNIKLNISNALFEARYYPPLLYILRSDYFHS